MMLGNSPTSRFLAELPPRRPSVARGHRMLFFLALHSNFRGLGDRGGEPGFQVFHCGIGKLLEGTLLEGYEIHQLRF